MKKILNTKLLMVSLILSLSFSLGGCVGMVIDAATDATIAVAKVPFKVGGAVIDVATGDDDDDEK